MQSELAPRSLRGAEDEPDADATAAALSAEDSESPFIRRVFSGRRRRRAVTDLSGATRRRPSFRRDVGHAASETYLITRLTLILLRSLGSANRVPAHGDSFMVLDQELCLGYSECINKILDLQVGYRWITKCLALGCYAMLLMPGFLQVAYYYFFSNQVRRSVVYGEQPRNRLDLYLPIDNDGSKPVVAFVTGGAWIIGYKAWGALLGKRLSERGIIVACIDYRNFPQGTISDMVNDVSKGISFVCNNAASFGGDPDRIYLIGQSAGAHIAVCTLFDQVIKECGEGENTGWSTCQIKTYFGLSGGYNVLNLVEHFHSRGLYRSLFLSIMEGEQSLRRFSPELLVQDLSVRHAVSLLPPIILYHGTGDYSIPSAASKDFADALESVGAQVKLLLYEGKTHTDLFLQDPLRGGRDELLEDVISVIRASDSSELVNDFVAPLARRLVPEFILKLASRISPF